MVDTPVIAGIATESASSLDHTLFSAKSEAVRVLFWISDPSIVFWRILSHSTHASHPITVVPSTLKPLFAFIPSEACIQLFTSRSIRAVSDRPEIGSELTQSTISQPFSWIFSHKTAYTGVESWST